MSETKENAIEQIADQEQNTKPDTKNMFSPVFIEAEKMFEKLAEVTNATAHKAYEMFLARGGELGKALDDWFNAESKILRPVAVEITEGNGKINVCAAVPGFKPEEIEVSVKNDLLILSGETEKREERKDENIVYTDWKSDRFFRQLTLPDAVNADDVKAELKDGILTLSLPKVTAEESKHVAVTAG